MTDKIEILICASIRDIAPEDWNTCAYDSSVDTSVDSGAASEDSEHQNRPADPFTTHAFLLALETSNSVGRGTGWIPQHLCAKQNGQIIAVAPCYAKLHSQGEYVFDFAWANAYEEAGGDYYPKLQISVPFTPVTGPRLLTRSGFEEIGKAALIQGAVTLCDQNDLSSLHLTFCTKSEAQAGKSMGLLDRLGQQFHWENAGYNSFDDFLAALSARKRKAIRKERSQAQRFDGEILQLSGDEIRPEHWDAFWQFYQDTGARKWGTPYLTRAFFDEIHLHMRNDILLVLAMRDDVAVAGALNFIGQNVLFGRYWGCLEDHPALHFELCYYQAIDFAIANGLRRVEAGAQGEHKLARGYMPSPTHSLHWIADPGFKHAIAAYLENERDAVDQEAAALAAFGPFKQIRKAQGKAK